MTANLRFLLVALLLTSASLFAQQNQYATWQPLDGNDNWLSPTKKVSFDAFLLNGYQQALELDSEEELILLRSDVDALGMTHHRYQQYVKDVRVAGAQQMIHENKDGSIRGMNGRLVRGIAGDAAPSIGSDAALLFAMEYMDAELYMWEVPAAEQMIKRVYGDELKSFCPKPELVWMDDEFSQEAGRYKLCYEMSIYAQKPHKREVVYVDAHTGEIAHTIEGLHTCSEAGSGETKYSGVQEFFTCLNEDQLYVLKETVRGKGIETYDMNNGTAYGDAVDFTHEDNYWDIANEEQNEAALDAHWGAEMTFDYFAQLHDYISFDNDSSLVVSYVHFDSSYVNASWNGTWMTYGDGNGSTTTPLTSLDVVGHELAHGVTQFTADLVYQDEPGALNESFSDIFGTAIEFFAGPENADWDIGEDFHTSETGSFRSMSDPKSKGDPDTYGGINFYTGDLDNGGVHWNSGIQNHWFYLLTEGGTGENDLDDIYTVEGIGMQNASKIAFRNLQYYLTVTSQYADAYAGARWAAEDLYGICSQEAKQTINAWYAVNVAEAVSPYDIRMVDVTAPVTQCGLSDAYVSVRMVHEGCDFSYTPDVPIPLTMMLDSSVFVQDTFYATTTIEPGDTMEFTFNDPVDVSEETTHFISVWSTLEGDAYQVNDSTFYSFDNNPQQNVDFGPVRVLGPQTGCGLSAAEPMVVEFGFFGCDSIEAGTSIQVHFEPSGLPLNFTDEIVLEETLYPNDVFEHTFTNTAYLGLPSSYYFDVWTTYAADIYTDNDTLYEHEVVNPYPFDVGDVITLEAELSMDSFLVTTTELSNVSADEAAAASGNNGLLMTGGDAGSFFFNGGLTIPEDATKVWLMNDLASAKACMCVDASAFESLQLSFDLKQTFSQGYNIYLGYDVPLASCMRVLVNNEQISGTYNPETYTEDPFVNQTLDLSDFAGTSFELCFETRNFQGPDFDELEDPETGDTTNGDCAYIDNIQLSGAQVGIGDIRPNDFAISLYPNPAQDQVYLQIDSPLQEEVEVKIMDVQGKSLQSFKQQLSQGQNQFSIQLNNYPKGVFFVQISGSTHQVGQRLIIH